MPKHESKNAGSPGMRLDKWLWCARFYKTRSQAADAIGNGRVLVSDEKAKPSRLVNTGARIKIRKTPWQFDITVTALSRNRKPAADVKLLYTETPESMAEREKISARLKSDALISPETKGRPTKRERRALLEFKNRL